MSRPFRHRPDARCFCPISCGDVPRNADKPTLPSMRVILQCSQPSRSRCSCWATTTAAEALSLPAVDADDGLGDDRGDGLETPLDTEGRDAAELREDGDEDAVRVCCRGCGRGWGRAAPPGRTDGRGGPRGGDARRLPQAVCAVGQNQLQMSDPPPHLSFPWATTAWCD